MVEGKAGVVTNIERKDNLIKLYSEDRNTDVIDILSGYSRLFAKQEDGKSLLERYITRLSQLESGVLDGAYPNKASEISYIKREIRNARERYLPGRKYLADLQKAEMEEEKKGIMAKIKKKEDEIAKIYEDIKASESILASI